jgi:hypothetical protein
MVHHHHLQKNITPPFTNYLQVSESISLYALLFFSFYPPTEDEKEKRPSCHVTICGLPAQDSPHLTL